jgi:hypothetical protein
MATVLVLAAVAFGIALPPVGALRDRQQLHAASASLAALVVRARAEAPARGGTLVELDAGRSLVSLSAGDSVLEEAWLERDHGVRLELGGGRDRADVVFDVLGLGRVASRTVVLVRGGLRDTLTVSSYGRVAR